MNGPWMFREPAQNETVGQTMIQGVQPRMKKLLLYWLRLAVVENVQTHKSRPWHMFRLQLRSVGGRAPNARLLFARI